MNKSLNIPLYYTGLQNKANVSMEGKASKNFPLNKKSELTIEVKLPPNGYTWIVIE
jgi:hypothetical protein